VSCADSIAVFLLDDGKTSSLQQCLQLRTGFPLAGENVQPVDDATQEATTQKVAFINDHKSSAQGQNAANLG
jgi:hypothetical protein